MRFSMRCGELSWARRPGKLEQDEVRTHSTKRARGQKLSLMQREWCEAEQGCGSQMGEIRAWGYTVGGVPNTITAGPINPHPLPGLVCGKQEWSKNKKHRRDAQEMINKHRRQRTTARLKAWHTQRAVRWWRGELRFLGDVVVPSYSYRSLGRPAFRPCRTKQSPDSSPPTRPGRGDSTTNTEDSNYQATVDWGDAYSQSGIHIQIKEAFKMFTLY